MESKDIVFVGVTAPEENDDKVVIAEGKEKPIYKVYGQDILVASDLAKSFYQSAMSLLCITNLLVGNFDDKGNYVIAKEIKRDLVVMNKEIDEQGEFFFKATNTFMKKNFYYYISITLQTDGTAKAALFLYEFVGDFLDKEFVVSHIANFVDVYDELYRDKLKKAFNLVDVALSNDETKIPTLAIMMQQKLDEKAKTIGLYDMACQAFVMRMMQELEKYEKGRKIAAEFKKVLAKLGLGKISWLKQKAILDRLINKYGGYEKLLKNMVTTRALMEDMIKSMIDIDKAKKEAEKEKEAQKPEGEKSAAKPATKKAAAKKTAAKKAVGKTVAKKKAAKKAENKKDEKKKSGGGVSDAERAKFAKQAEAELAKQIAAEKAKAPKEDVNKEPPKKEEVKKENANNNRQLPDETRKTRNDDDDFYVYQVGGGTKENFFYNGQTGRRGQGGNEFKNGQTGNVGGTEENFFYNGQSGRSGQGDNEFKNGQTGKGGNGTHINEQEYVNER